MDEKGIARALREGLKNMGVELSHSQALELVASATGLKNWNVLTARLNAEPAASVNELHCPGCGRSGGLKNVANAFVEQGPGTEHGYAFEGHADHYQCDYCGKQFLDWSSDWPQYANETDRVISVELWFGANAYVAKLYPLGPLLAASRGMKEFQDLDLEAHKKALVALAADGSFINSLAGRNYIDAEERGSGETTGAAVKELLSRLGVSKSAKVVNPGVGI